MSSPTTGEGHGITVNCLAPGWFPPGENKILYEDKEWVEYLSIAFREASGPA
jgi:NAD(P)-dependent dehydrogenase (short-subunit alcohol dehydrogenase family)